MVKLSHVIGGGAVGIKEGVGELKRGGAHQPCVEKKEQELQRVVMAYQAVEENEVSEESFSPTAPPRASQQTSLRSGSGSPPRYDSVLANDPKARQVAAQVRAGRTLQGSLARAGEFHIPGASCLIKNCVS